MARGRPLKSGIRQNIVDILFFMKKGYGYDIYRVYCEIFPKATLRSIYYNLRKGAELGEFRVKEIKHEKGEYSWGADAEKIYYALGTEAKPSPDIRIKKFFEKQKA